MIIKMGLLLIYYRIKSFKLAVNASFYYLVYLKPLLSLIFAIQSALWIILIVILSPLELILMIILQLFDLLTQSHELEETFKEIASDYDRTPEAIKREYEEYKDDIFKY